MGEQTYTRKGEEAPMCAIIMQEQREYTVRDVARILGVNRMTVIRRLEAGKIRARKEGNRWRIREDDLNSYIDQTYREGTERTP